MAVPLSKGDLRGYFIILMYRVPPPDMELIRLFAVGKPKRIIIQSEVLTGRSL